MLRTEDDGAVLLPKSVGLGVDKKMLQMKSMCRATAKARHVTADADAASRGTPRPRPWAHHGAFGGAWQQSDHSTQTTQHVFTTVFIGTGTSQSLHAWRTLVAPAAFSRCGASQRAAWGNG